MRIFSYVLRHDDGAAPNPFWGMCTLTICKPVIRRNAAEKDWIIGTGSKNSKLKDGKTYDFSKNLVYAMKVTKILSLPQYDAFCKENYKNKLPQWEHQDWRMRMGDCIYDFTNKDITKMRKGVHKEVNKPKDLSGKNSLLSDFFYYFGENPVPIPEDLHLIIKQNQGHKKIENLDLIKLFEDWILTFEKNNIQSDPQLRYRFDRPQSERQISLCSSHHLKDDEDESEETIC